jgi:SET and MYND domain-containing protein
MDNEHLSMRSLEAIAKDEEIFISYIDHTYPFSQRQSELKERFFFDCKCTKCLHGPTLNEDRWTGDPHKMPKDWERYCEVIRSTDPKFADDLHEHLDKINNSDEAMRIIQDWAFHALKTIHHQEFGPARVMANVKNIMNMLAQTERCPIYRQPYPSARHELLQSCSHNANFFLAWAHGAKTYFYVDPLLYPQTYHPLRVVHNANLAMLTLVVSTDPSLQEHSETKDMDFGVLVYYLFLEVVANVEKSHGKDNSFAKLLKRKFDQVTTDMTRADLNAVRKLEQHRDKTWRQFRKFADNVHP